MIILQRDHYFHLIPSVNSCATKVMTDTFVIHSKDLCYDILNTSLLHCVYTRRERHSVMRQKQIEPIINSDVVYTGCGMTISIFPILFLMYSKRTCNFCHKGQMDLQRSLCHVQAVHRNNGRVQCRDSVCRYEILVKSRPFLL